MEVKEGRDEIQAPLPMHVKLMCSGLCSCTRQELVNLAKYGANSLSEPYTVSPPPVYFTLPIFLPPSHSALQACVLAERSGTRCQIGGLSFALAHSEAMDRKRAWRGRERQSWREKGKKKKLLSGLPAVVRALPTLIRSSFFALHSLLSVPPPTVSLSLFLAVCLSFSVYLSLSVSRMQSTHI